MNLIGRLLSGSVEKVIDSIGNAADSLITSDEERLKVKNQLLKIKAEHEIGMEKLINEAEKDITERWKSDNEHKITRLVRPISFAWVIILFTTVMIGDTNFGFTIKDAYIPVLETLLTTMVVAYFGSRGIEKTAKHLKK